jgi:hypothetical protein
MNQSRKRIQKMEQLCQQNIYKYYYYDNVMKIYKKLLLG